MFENDSTVSAAAATADAAATAVAVVEIGKTRDESSAAAAAAAVVEVGGAGSTCSTSGIKCGVEREVAPRPTTSVVTGVDEGTPRSADE